MLDHFSHNAHFAEFLQGGVHALLHDEKLLFLLLNHARHLTVLFVDLVQEIVNLQLLRL